MNKVINAILGIGIAIIIYLFFLVAMKLALPEPDMENCWERFESRSICPQNMTEEKIESQRIESDACYEKTNEIRGNYSEKIFIISVIIGVLLILGIIPLLVFPNIAAGVGAAGIALTVYGFAVGWNHSANWTKLILLFISAAVIITMSVWLNIKKAKPKRKHHK